MRIIISGSREFNNYEIIENKILDIIGKLNSNNNIEIVSGGCRVGSIDVLKCLHTEMDINSPSFLLTGLLVNVLVICIISKWLSIHQNL